MLPPALPPGAQARDRGAAGAADDGAAVLRAVHVVAAVVRADERLCLFFWWRSKQTIASALAAIMIVQRFKEESFEPDFSPS